MPQVSGRGGARLARGPRGRSLPVGYFHVVFTLPTEIAPLAYQNQAVVYDLLFRTAAKTLLTIAADPNTSALASAPPPCSTAGAQR